MTTAAADEGMAPSDRSRDSYPAAPAWPWPQSWTERGRLRPGQVVARVAGCGLPTRESSIVLDAAGARWDGTYRCESTWLCPTCTTIRRMRVARELAEGLRQQGGVAQMVTLTIRHQQGTPLDVCLRALDSAWIETRHDGSWCRWWGERVRASARAVEITRGPHGWHPHIHLLVLLASGDEITEADRDRLAERWQRAAARGPAGSDWTPTWISGVVVSRATSVDDVSRETSASAVDIAARYVTKAGLEISGGGKDSARSLWRVARAAAAGDARAREVWTEISRATRGRHAVHLDRRMRCAVASDDVLERHLAERAGGSVSAAAQRIRVPPAARAALAWSERAWHPAALRVPVVLAARAELAEDALRGFWGALQDAHAHAQPERMQPWEVALGMPGVAT